MFTTELHDLHIFTKSGIKSSPGRGLLYIMHGQNHEKSLRSKYVIVQV